jgi:hypothetical protein
MAWEIKGRNRQHWLFSFDWDHYINYIKNLDRKAQDSFADFLYPINEGLSDGIGNYIPFYPTTTTKKSSW